MSEQDNTLDSFAAKWIAVEPELGIALNFLPMPRRALEAAFACLSREISHAAFAIREDQVAIAKLNWWHEELARASNGEPRHPLTQVLTGHGDLAQVSRTAWQAVIVAALQQRERDPAADFPSQLAGFQTLYQRLAEVEAVLLDSIDHAATARIAALAHMLREAAAMGRVLETGHVALPLDLLARHQLRRDQLANDNAERRRAAAEQLQAIEAELGATLARKPAIALTRRAGLLADRWRADKASRAADPVAKLQPLLAKVSLGTTWKLWRNARWQGARTGS